MLKLENVFIYSKKTKHDYNSGLVKEIHFNTKSQFDYGQSVFTKFFLHIIVIKTFYTEALQIFTSFIIFD